jgi:hypothetical protein
MTTTLRITTIVAALAAVTISLHVALSLWMHGLIISGPPPQSTLTWISWGLKLMSMVILVLLLRRNLQWWLLLAVPLYLVSVEVLGFAASLAVLGRYGIGL